MQPKVSILRLLKVVHVRGCGQVGPTFEASKMSGMKNVTFELGEVGVTMSGIGTTGSPFSIIFPFSMVESIQFEADSKS